MPSGPFYFVTLIPNQITQKRCIGFKPTFEGAVQSLPDPTEDQFKCAVIEEGFCGTFPVLSKIAWLRYDELHKEWKRINEPDWSKTFYNFAIN